MPPPASSSAEAGLARGAVTCSTGLTRRTASISIRPPSNGSGFRRRSSRSTASERPPGASGGLDKVAWARVRVGSGRNLRSIRPPIVTVWPVIASASSVT